MDVIIIKQEFQENDKRDLQGEKLYFKNIKNNEYYSISKVKITDNDFFTRKPSFEYMPCKMHFINNEFILDYFIDDEMFRSERDDIKWALKKLGFNDVTIINKLKEF